MFNLCLSCLRGEFILFNHCMCDLEDCMLAYFWRPVRFSFIYCGDEFCSRFMLKCDKFVLSII